MFRRVHAGVLAVVVMLVSVGGTASAAQTPEPVVPTSCFVEPVGILDLLAVLNDVDQAQFEPPISSVPLSEIVPGTSVSAEDMSAISSTNEELVGCINSGQVFSALALLTERFHSRLALELLEGDEVEGFLEQVPILVTETAETGGVASIPVRAAWYTDSGERAIMAIVEPVVSDPSAQRSFLVTYVFSIDRWLIDDIQLVTGS